MAAHRRRGIREMQHAASLQGRLIKRTTQQQRTYTAQECHGRRHQKSRPKRPSCVGEGTSYTGTYCLPYTEEQRNETQRRRRKRRPNIVTTGCSHNARNTPSRQTEENSRDCVANWGVPQGKHQVADSLRKVHQREAVFAPNPVR